MKKFLKTGIHISSLPIFIILISFSSGCGGSSPQMMNVSLNCDDNCNNTNAIVLTIYQLKNADKFRNTSFESLIRSPEDALGDDIIPDSKYEKTLVPGEGLQLKDLKIKENAMYLGVLGDFHSPAKDGWHQIITLNPDIKRIQILVHENSLSYSLK